MAFFDEILYRVSVLAGFIGSNDILAAIAILVGSYLGAGLIYFVLEKYVSRLTKATKTTLDDELLLALKRPIYIAAIAFGIYLSLLRIKALNSYSQIISLAAVSFFILLGAYTIARVISTFMLWYAESLADKTHTAIDQRFIPVINKILSIFIYILALVVILDHLGVKVTALVASLGVASLAVALALQDTLANFFAGLYIVLDKPFKPKDLVKLESGEEGTVDEIGWRSTKIKLGTGNILIVPNSTLAKSRILNYNLPIKYTSFSVACGVSYDSDLDKVEKVTIKAAKEILKETKGGVQDFEPSVRFTAFGDNNILFTVSMKINVEQADKAFVTHELMKALIREYKKEGIEISYPVRRILSDKPKSKKSD